MTDYYKILGVAQTASELEIKTAYRKLSKKFHPDLNQGDKFFEERFKDIQEAYETLSDIKRRIMYDENLKVYNNRENSTFQTPPKETPNQEATHEPSFNRSNSTKGKNYTSSFIRIIIFLVILAIIRSATNKSIVASAKENYSIPSTRVDNSNLKVDSGYHLKDTAVSYPSQNVNSANPFFGIKLNFNNVIIPLDSFPKGVDSNYDLFYGGQPKISFQDLDNDGIPEIITKYWGGGAHCCDVNNIFVYESDHLYNLAFEFHGGLTISGNEIECNFYETIGYFFSCYSCSLDDSMPNRNFRPVINLIFEKGKISTDKYNSYVNEQVIKDLDYLSKREVPLLDSMNFDDGTRKAYASRIITMFFNNSNIFTTKDTFYKYYLGSDADIIWRKIVENMQFILKNDFAGISITANKPFAN